MPIWSTGCGYRLGYKNLHRFPAETELRRSVEECVAADAGQGRLQEQPDAALLLATPSVAKSGDSVVANLNNWAAAPLLQVTL